MLYLVHDDRGLIEQANKVFATGKLGDYEQRMKDMGLQFVRRDLPGAIDSEAYYVGGAGRVLRRRPMNVQLPRRIIRADAKDQVVLSGLPRPSQVTMAAGSWVMLYETIPDGKVAIATDTPGIFSVTIEAFPFLPWSAELEAVS